MFKKPQISSLLFVLFITESTLLAQGDVEGDTITNEDDSISPRLFCQDNAGACPSKNGSCQFSPFDSCREVDGSLCGVLCYCCVPCGGACGPDGDGTCKRRCALTDDEIPDAGCDGQNCRCCTPKQKCGDGDAGLCKPSCNIYKEDTVTGNCTVEGKECCAPKQGCTARCGLNYKYTCKDSNLCPFWKRRFGNCPLGCTCCSISFWK